MITYAPGQCSWGWLFALVFWFFGAGLEGKGNECVRCSKGVFRGCSSECSWPGTVREIRKTQLHQRNEQKSLVGNKCEYIYTYPPISKTHVTGANVKNLRRNRLAYIHWPLYIHRSVYMKRNKRSFASAFGEPCQVSVPLCRRERRTSMFKESIIKRIASTTGEPRRKVARFMSMFLDCVQIGLVKEKKVVLRGLGSFHVRVRKARRVANPRTGEIMTVPASNVVRFRAGERLRKYVRSGVLR
jgi:DNA-binding protein HU-beta